jgi:hypothetical protein
MNMIDKFDINFVTSNFGTCNLKFYLDLLHAASKSDLSQLKKEIKHHKKINRQQKAFSNVNNFSTHDAIIAAINHEFLKRSPFYGIYKGILIIRRKIVKIFTGLELKEHEYFGSLYSQPQYLQHYYLHMPHTELFPIIGRFWLRRWTIILPVIVTAAITLFIYFDSKATAKATQEQKKAITNEQLIRHK